MWHGSLFINYLNNISKKNLYKIDENLNHSKQKKILGLDKQK